ncbi:hypothetical protein AUC69_14305 [Methyloceanibacter superfactus]|uniref:Uncharacterized protein n=1 Tax=Methyloceanibacter superfactus TaxID=1774969 RepID=A0A1E3VTA5_9HYPH|nr:hypothetical protein AUC69_14305 [Methyloceanibacter superfactus]
MLLSFAQRSPTPICAPSKQERKSYRVEAKMKRNVIRIWPALMVEARFLLEPHVVSDGQKTGFRAESQGLLAGRAQAV